MESVRMVTFLTHTRGDVLLKPGAEFEVSAEEAHGYAARKNPLAGPLDAEEPKEPAQKAKPNTRRRPGGKKAK